MKRFFLHIAALLISFSSQAQSTPDLFGINLEDQEYFIHNIKSVQQFMDRFNFSKDLSGKKVDTDPKEPKLREVFVQDRLKSILSSFDYQWIRTASKQKQQLIREFVNLVNDQEDPIFLQFKDDDWYAKLTYDATSGGKKIDLTIVLRSYQGSNGGTAWTIQSVKSEALSLEGSTNKLNVILPPNSDGTDFINLKQSLSNQLELKRLIAQKTGLSPFYEMLLQQKITLNFVKDIQYHFLQVENYILTVSEFRRKDNNSGWLISALERSSKEDKIFYRQKKLFIAN